VLRTQISIVELATSATCNVCGKTEESEEPTAYRVPNMWEFTASGGYDDHEMDLTTKEWVECSTCLFERMKTFVVPVKTSVYRDEAPTKVFHSETSAEKIWKNGWLLEPHKQVPSEWFEADYSDITVEGVYRHFKGDHYLVLGFAKDYETSELVVVYRGLSGESLVWARPIASWEQEAPEGEVRFRYLGVLDKSPSEKGKRLGVLR
jgi:hypothetical protein